MKNIQASFLSEDNKLIAILVEPRYRLVRHLLLTLMLMLLVLINYNNIRITYWDDLHIREANVLFYSAAVEFCLYIGIGYLNIYLLMPRLFFKSRYVSYCLAFLGGLSLVCLISYLTDRLMFISYDGEDYTPIDYFISIAITGLSCIGISITLLFRHWLTDGRLREEMEARQLRSRIDRLKTSVNSEFLSRTLETAAERTLTDRDSSVDLLSRLGRFLRYRLYDSNRKFVMLNSEIAFLDNYLSLIRETRNNFTYSLTSYEKIVSKAVPPSLLINITDVILEHTEGAASSGLNIRFYKAGENALAFEIAAFSPGISAVSGNITDTIISVLGVALSSDYTLTCKTGTDRYEAVLAVKTRGTL